MHLLCVCSVAALCLYVAWLQLGASEVSKHVKHLMLCIGSLAVLQVLCSHSVDALWLLCGRSLAALWLGSKKSCNQAVQVAHCQGILNQSRIPKSQLGWNFLDQSRIFKLQLTKKNLDQSRIFKLQLTKKILDQSRIFKLELTKKILDQSRNTSWTSYYHVGYKTKVEFGQNKFPTHIFLTQISFDPKNFRPNFS